ncbi:MAG: membrane-bound lytic murein transglycosylase D [Arcticibacterium sp.]|jgi:membrane-bound lytic murein transglycosylase D
MFKNKLAILGIALLLASTQSSFSQSDSLQNPAFSIKQVDQIVIGKKISKADSNSQNAPALKTVSQQAIFPGSITVMDNRDNVEFQIIPESDSVIAARIKRLENIMPMPYNEHVKKYVDYFLYKRPNFIKQMLERKEFYFPVFEKYLAKHGIPDEMKYLALLESGLDPKAISHAKAVGLWQFMSPTGKEYGLEINGYMDERMHIEKSTEASFKYLTWLHNYFHDWELALASYNTGPGNLRRAIRKSGKTDYWELHNYIHRDTRAYVPQWAALNYLMNYSAEHGIFPDYNLTYYPQPTEDLVVNGPLNLVSFAELNYLDLETLKRLNPHITSDNIPSYARNLELKLPLDTYAYFKENQSCILDLSSALSVPSLDVDVHSDSKGYYHYERKSIKEYHRVRSGEYLGKIASKYGVGVSSLKNWNGLRSNTIQKGQRLVYYKNQNIKVYDGPLEIKEAPKATLASKTSEQRSNVKVVTDVKTKPSLASKTPEVINVVSDTRSSDNYKNVSKTVKRYHFIRSGENLTTIARKRGVTVGDLRKWNNLKSSNIMKGQRLAFYTTITEKVYDNVESDDKNSILVYTVQKGDTLWAISKKYGHSVAEIKRLNGFTDNTVKVGQKIKVKA